MRSTSELFSTVDSVNWNFNFKQTYSQNELRPFNCRKFFSYPATFIPDIPFSLIEILSKKGDNILDPFGGIGTTFFQSIVQERNATSLDNNIVAHIVNSNVLNLFNNDNIEDYINNIKKIDYSSSFDNYLEKERLNLVGWFDKKTLSQLSIAIKYYDDLTDGAERAFFELCLLNAITSLSSQNKGWAYIADNVKPKDVDMKYKDVEKLILFTAKQHQNEISNYSDHLSKNAISFIENVKSNWNSNIINANFLDVELTDCHYDLIVTSPPYPNMIDYVKSQRLSYYLINKSWKDFVSTEIGARCNRHRKMSIGEYKTMMIGAIQKMFNSLKYNGYMCLIFPEFPITDARNATINELVDFCKKQFGYKQWKKINRYIPSTKREQNNHIASLQNEQILIFKKES